MRSAPVSTRGIEQAILKTPSVSNAWQLGTLLKAVALSDSVDGTVKLQIGARIVSAQTSLPLQSGQALRLQVAETGRTVVLRSVPEPANGDPVRAGIRQDLPRQMPQAPVMAAALSLSKTSSSLPAGLTEAAGRLVSAMRSPETLAQGQGLRLAVRDSGNFLEQRLLEASSKTDRPAAALSRDWKAALLRFRQQLSQLQARLAGDTGPKQPSRPLAQSPAPATSAAGSGARPPGGANSAIPVAPTSAAQGNAANTPVTVQVSVPGAQPPTTASPLPPPVATAGTTPTAAQPGSPQAADNVVPSGVNTQGSVAAKDIPPPLRHALPHPQPVIQAGKLPADLPAFVSELISNSDGALARVRLNQFGSVTPDHGSRLVWLLELPVHHPDDRAEVVTMRVEKDDGSHDRQANPAWTADLAFDLGAKGALRARVALRAGRVSVLFWADDDRTRVEVRDRLPQLKDAMEQKQLDVATLSAGADQPAAPPVPSASLLETQA